MDLNNIELTGKIVADLYPGSLVEASYISAPAPSVNNTSEKENRPDAPLFKSLGDNKKNILIIINSPDAVFLTDNELTFLMGILGACKLSMADVALINLHQYPDAVYKDLIHYFKSKIVLLFDTEPAAFGMPVNFPQYQLQAFAGNTFLYSPSLKLLENDRVEKSKLWVCLKRLFNL